MQFLAPRDLSGRFCFAAVQSATGQAVLQRFGIPTQDWDSFVLVEDSRIYFKSEAFFRTVRHMTYPWPLLGVGRLPPRALGDWLYDRVARNRYAIFGQRAVCMVPRPELASRFLP